MAKGVGGETPTGRALTGQGELRYTQRIFVDAILRRLVCEQEVAMKVVLTNIDNSLLLGSGPRRGVGKTYYQRRSLHRLAALQRHLPPQAGQLISRAGQDPTFYVLTNPITWSGGSESGSEYLSTGCRGAGFNTTAQETSLQRGTGSPIRSSRSCSAYVTPKTWS
ncbi:hypothetical protein E2C01_098063 [Portunus trituberculatus]|uniref:Uncharacterized protein n=1 Tax=Portunus trituberculatus TaxID=210409 RepID=A0A5B7K6Q1_PORTR|nr:hypothetical protein [Portunus trituberculatus]